MSKHKRVVQLVSTKIINGELVLPCRTRVDTQGDRGTTLLQYNEARAWGQWSQQYDIRPSVQLRETYLLSVNLFFYFLRFRHSLLRYWMLQHPESANPRQLLDCSKISLSQCGVHQKRRNFRPILILFQCLVSCLFAGQDPSKRALDAPALLVPLKSVSKRI